MLFDFGHRIRINSPRIVLSTFIMASCNDVSVAEVGNWRACVVSVRRGRVSLRQVRQWGRVSLCQVRQWGRATSVRWDSEEGPVFVRWEWGRVSLCQVRQWGRASLCQVRQWGRATSVRWQWGRASLCQVRQWGRATSVRWQWGRASLCQVRQRGRASLCQVRQRGEGKSLSGEHSLAGRAFSRMPTHSFDAADWRYRPPPWHPRTPHPHLPPPPRRVSRSQRRRRRRRRQRRDQ